ncbi:MAG TPA: hypothetical protein VI039_12920 [Solirubrobacterales bacterium]
MPAKTPAPTEAPYSLKTDKPANIEAATKPPAERLAEILEDSDYQPLSWLKKGTKKQIIVCNSSGVPQYVTMVGDATIDEEGSLQLGSKVVGTSELGDKAVTTAKLDDDSVGSAAIAPGAVGASEVANASLTDAELESPNNGVWKTIAQAQGMVTGGLALGDYIFTNTGLLKSEGTAVNQSIPFIGWRPADVAVAGKTTKMRVNGQIAVNGTAPTTSFELELSAFSIPLGSGATEIKLSKGSVVISGATFAAPGSRTQTQAVGSEKDVPVEGIYVPTIRLLASTPAGASFCVVSWQLQIRHV